MASSEFFNFTARKIIILGTFREVNFYLTQVYLGSDRWVQVSLSTRLFADLIGVTLADDDSNSTPTDDVNRAM